MNKIADSQPMSWGPYFKHLRISRIGKSLREFCQWHGFDAGNLSKYERGVIPPPQDEQALKRYAAALNLVSGTPEWDRFYDLASLEHGMVPTDFSKDENLMPMLPVLLRTISQSKLTREELEQLIERIRSGAGGTTNADSVQSKNVR